MILTPEVITIFILDGLSVFFGFLTFLLSIKIATKWDFSKNTQEQYTLEKQSYLASTIIKYILYLKVALFVFFIWSIDKLSNIVIGAMCGAGVVNASVYGIYTLIFKIINIYLFGYWIALHKKDMTYEDVPYTKTKFTMFIFVFVLLVCEIVLEFLMFSGINPQKLVSCCGTIYNPSADTSISAIFNIDTKVLLGIFYGNFLLIILSYIAKKRELFALFNFLFVIVSLISIIVFFSTYIYELPTHHCPFCMLQGDYDYVGYFIYMFLFVGTFYGLIVGFLDNGVKNYRLSVIFDAICVATLSAYPVLFYIKNGVWL